jgi:predicted RNA-binding protein with PIN domain
MKDHPEVWGANLVFGHGAGWNKGVEMDERSEETKQKISESMKKTLAEKKEVKK